jgi:5-methylcytosine-specific restriction protein B
MVDALVETIAERDDLSADAKRDGYRPDDYDNMADRLVITLKGGAIRNGYLTVPKLQRLFPDECLAREDHPAQQLFTLRLPDGTSQHTQVLTQHNRIQARFNALFAREQLQPGDQAVLTKLADYDYQLSFGRTGEQLEYPPTKAVNMDQEALMCNVPLNQILFGPPGTGKTYETIDSALEILAPEMLKLSREERKARFDELVEAQRIRFVTFHQSFSYEDFVEGLRAEPATANAEGVSAGVQYRVQEGVFLQMCREALRDRAFEQRVGVRDDAKVWKISIEEASSQGVTRKYCFEHGEARIGWPIAGDIRLANLADPDLKLGTNEQSSLACFGLSVEPGDVLVCLSSKNTISAVGVVTGEYEYSAQVPLSVREDYVHRLPVNWLAKGVSFDITGLNHGVKLTQKTMYELWRITWPSLQAALLREGILLGDESMQERQESLPHVLIIDEINRGNVSRIFGELITLIESSKRMGAEEAVSVMLPYSKQTFSVPSNVYLLGTMNTADRSLSGLDIALRRRFSFREMPPRPELLDAVMVEGVSIGDVLRTINQRIEVLLDRDHCLGHAYFMPLLKDRSLERLGLIFRNQILPLLQEYFFEDWQRIQWVLNDHRKPAVDRFVLRHKQDLGSLFGGSVPAQGQTWRINSTAFSKISAYAGVIAMKAEAEVHTDEFEEFGA